MSLALKLLWKIELGNFHRRWGNNRIQCKCFKLLSPHSFMRNTFLIGNNGKIEFYTELSWLLSLNFFSILLFLRTASATRICSTFKMEQKYEIKEIERENKPKETECWMSWESGIFLRTISNVLIWAVWRRRPRCSICVNVQCLHNIYPFFFFFNITQRYDVTHVNIFMRSNKLESPSKMPRIIIYLYSTYYSNANMPIFFYFIFFQLMWIDGRQITGQWDINKENAHNKISLR